MPMKTIVFGIVIALLAIFAFFALGGVVENIWQALVGVLIVGMGLVMFAAAGALLRAGRSVTAAGKTRPCRKLMPATRAL
jgi:uncharacterized membrane protein YidH (DUF202 family)